MSAPPSVVAALRSLEELCLRAGLREECVAVSVVVDAEMHRGDLFCETPSSRAEHTRDIPPLSWAYAVAHVLEREAAMGEPHSVPVITWEHCGRSRPMGVMHCDRCWHLRPRRYPGRAQR